MGKRSHPKLVCIEDNREITWESAPDFLRMLQDSLLLALKEQNFLTSGQYEDAAHRLHRWR